MTEMFGIGQLLNFCSEHRPEISAERINHSLGKLVYSDGEVYTVEKVDVENRRYTLIPVAIYNGTFSGINEGILDKLASLPGKKLEFLALNTHMFPIFPEEEWDEWEPMERKDGHEQIYQQILRTLQSYASDGERVLVVGCGRGEFLDTLTQQGYDIIGIDPNQRNIESALAQDRKVWQGKIEEATAEVDVIIEPGVLSAGVVDREYALSAIPRLASMLRKKGILIHAPFSRSLLCAADLTAGGFDVLNMTFPENLFTYDQPKQFYVAQKSDS